MRTNWLRRSLGLAAACAALLLAACGSGSIESQFTPARVVAFGDALGDLGQTGPRYTINDNTTNIWTQQTAASYGYSLGTVNVSGGTSYATANARIATTPDLVGKATTPSLEQQIGTFLASNTLGASDLVLVSAGTSDIVAEGRRVITGGQTADTALANVRAAARALGAQVRRLVTAGGKHVVIAGPYNLAKTPWGLNSGQTGLLDTLSGRFNDELLLSIVDLGESVLYVDAALEYNLFVGFPSSFTLTNVTGVACTSVDPGVGIGVGAGQVNSALCTSSTVASDFSNAIYLWADPLYPTPAAHRLFGDYAFQRIRQRW